MALQGTIDAFPVVDVLQLLAGSHKTGRLIVEGDRSTAQLFVVDGAVTAGGVQGVDDAPIADVVAELLRYQEGSFLFEPGTVAPGEHESEDLLALVETGRERLAAWVAIEEVVPSMSHRLALVPEIGDDGIQLSAQDWALVVAAGAGCRVGDLVAATGSTDIAVCADIVGLVERGVLTVEAPSAELVPLAVVTSDASSPAADPSAPVAGHDTSGSTSFELVDTDEDDVAMGELVADAFPEESDVAAAASLDGEEAAYEVVLLDESDDTGSFPEHFPIDDLLGADEEVDPWVQMEAAGREDRLAAAQSFGDDPAPVSDAADADRGLGGFSSEGFSAGLADHGIASPTDSGGVGSTGASGSSDAGLFGGAPAFDDAPAFSDATGFGDAAGFGDSARFSDGAGFSDGAAFSDAGSFGTAAGFGDPTGFADAGAFTDPIDPGSAFAAAPSDGPTGAANFVGDGAFTAAPAGAPVAVREAVQSDPSADNAADEVLRQMSKLSPKAAEAIAAALGSSADSRSQEGDGT